jgi:hypothetical protein
MSSEPCPVEGCPRTIAYNGMCKRHAARVARCGDPLAFKPYSERGFRHASDNFRWAGDDVTYYGMHRRVRVARGPARDHLCNECGGPAAHWSYDHADPGEQKSDVGAYSVNVDHYVPRCVPCHKRLDLALKPPKPDTLIDLEAVKQLRAEWASARSIAELLGVPWRRVQRALDEMGLPRTVRMGGIPEPRCDQPMRPWRGVVNLCSRPQGHPGKHEARRRPKTYLTAPPEGAEAA